MFECPDGLGHRIHVIQDHLAGHFTVFSSVSSHFAFRCVKWIDILLKRRHPNAERLQRLTQHAQKDFYKRSGEDVGEDEAVHYCDQRCDDGVRFFIYTSAVLAASDAAEPQATNGSSDVPRITLMRGASIEDFQMVKNPGYYCTSSAHYVGTFWDYSNVEDPDFDLCDLKLVFCSNPAEKGCCIID